MSLHLEKDIEYKGFAEEAKIVIRLVEVEGAFFTTLSSITIDKDDLAEVMLK